MSAPAIDPVDWAAAMFGDTPWSKQRDLLRECAAGSRIAVKASHGTGKTWLAARIAIYRWLATDGAVLVTTAPTFRQVNGLLWREIRRAERAARRPGARPLSPGRPLPKQPYWDAHPEDPERWLAMGISADNADSLQGWHDRTMIAVIDEAAGVEPWVWDAVIAFQPDLVLAIGNPTDPESPFALCFDSPRWSCHTISAFDSPNLTGECDALWGGQHPALVTPAWVDEVRERYGEHEAYWIARVLGEFPESSEDSLIPGSWFDNARGVLGHPHRWRSFGVDLAKFGGDSTRVSVWDEGCLVDVLTIPPGDLMATTGRIVQLARERKPWLIGVDDTGLVGVADRLRELGLPVMPIVPGSGPTDSERYVNLRAEMAWTLREAIRNGDVRIGGKWLELREEGRQTRYDHTSAGKTYLEPKERTKQRIGRSPDSLDAVMYGYWVACMVARDIAKRRSPGKRPKDGLPKEWHERQDRETDRPGTRGTKSLPGGSPYG